MALIKGCVIVFLFGYILTTTALHRAVAESINHAFVHKVMDLHEPKADEPETTGEMTRDWEVGDIEDYTKPEEEYPASMSNEGMIEGYSKEELPEKDASDENSLSYGGVETETSNDFQAPADNEKREISNGHELTRKGEMQQVRRPGPLSLVTNYVAIGYNLLRANPEGDFSRGGLDPGLKLARRILKLTYSRGKTAYYKGRLTSVPDQVHFHQVHTCSSAQRVKAYSGTSSYQKKLDVNVKVRGGGNYGLFRFRFSLSTAYSEAEARTSSRKGVMMDKEVVCNAGRARYLLDTAFNNHYSIADDFYYAVKNLPARYVKTSYMNFIERWGTHIIVGTDLGGRQIERYRSKYSQLYRYASSRVKSSVSVGGSYLGYSGSLSVNVNTFNKRVSRSARFGSYQYRLNSGSTIVKDRQGHYHIQNNDPKPPIPIHMSLTSITTALDPRLWTQLPERGKTYTSLGISGKLRNLVRALREYPAWSRASTSSDPAVRIPNAWPDGTYSLPRSRYGCPSGGRQFTWHYGWRYHDTEDRRNRNRFSRPLTLSGSFGRNIRVDYCTKTDTSRDYGIKWPKGSYCIAKKGTCPSGFRAGYIYWDDEDRRNRNRHGGILPDGSYNRNTRTYFCCRSDGFATNPIILPRDRPFFLYRQHSRDGCQRVRGMRYREEWVYWDNEDRRNRDSKSGAVPFEDGGRRNHKLHYCYYYR